MNRKRIYFLLIMPTFLTGCSYEYHIKDEGIVFKQRQLFNQLCDAKDRSIIYKTVRVDGYLLASRGGGSCQNGWEPIFLDGYRYAECTKSPVYGSSLPLDADTYHFTIENNGHPGCGTGKQWFIKRFKELYHGNDPTYKETNLWKHYRKKHQSQLPGKCLVVQKVDKPKSRYMYLSTLSYYDEHEKMYYDELKKKYRYESESKKGLISSSDSHYVEISTGDVLAKNSNYTFHRKGRKFSFSSSIKCEKSKDISPSEVFKLKK